MVMAVLEMREPGHSCSTEPRIPLKMKSVESHLKVYFTFELLSNHARKNVILRVWRRPARLLGSILMEYPKLLHPSVLHWMEIVGLMHS